jgi:hypothetical protein
MFIGSIFHQDTGQVVGFILRVLNMLEAIEKYGALKGTFIAIKRIIRCHPFNKGGYDPLK